MIWDEDCPRLFKGYSINLYFRPIIFSGNPYFLRIDIFDHFLNRSLGNIFACLCIVISLFPNKTNFSIQLMKLFHKSLFVQFSCTDGFQRGSVMLHNFSDALCDAYMLQSHAWNVWTLPSIISSGIRSSSTSCDKYSRTDRRLFSLIPIEVLWSCKWRISRLKSPRLSFQMVIMLYTSEPKKWPTEAVQDNKLLSIT